MKRRRPAPGLVLAEIEGAYLLVADKEARKYCPYIREIDETSAFLWKELEAGKGIEEMILSLQESYEIPEGTDLQEDILGFLKVLEEDHYLITEEEG